MSFLSKDHAAATDEECEKRMWRRVGANDPLALQTAGNEYYRKQDYEIAYQYYTRAAEEGIEDARFRLGLMYYEGKHVEENEDECIFFWEQAAISGHVRARYDLGGLEWNNGRYDRAVKHWIISANLGDDKSIEWLTKCYKEGHVSKDDFARALRANQAAVDAMKSPQREAAEIYFQAQDKDEDIFSSR